MKDIPEPEPLVEVTRGSITESRHRGHIVAVDVDGRIVAQLGAPETVTYLRSSSKPHQAIPLITSGAADHFNFSDKEIAIASGSHNGDPMHTETVASMLRKIGLDASALKCGVHEPYSPEAARALREQGEKPNVLQSNCSGKHAGMLALAVHLGAPVETYDQPDHPVQLMIGRTMALFSGVPLEDIAVGVDGCGVPTFGVTVYAMALMYARLVSPPDEFDEKLREACRRIVSAMMEYPEMVGGPTEAQDTALMRAAHGRLIAKAGAEGVFTGGILPCDEWPKGLGVALKIEDGDGKRRARRPIVTETLRQLGVLDHEALEQLRHYAASPVTNHRGDEVGEVRASFTLKRESASKESS